MNDRFVTDAVKVFKALADPTRYQIVTMLLQRSELGCTELARAFPISRPAMSHHYRILEHAGLVETRKAGSHVFFRLNLPRLHRFVPGFAGAHRASGKSRPRGRAVTRSSRTDTRKARR